MNALMKKSAIDFSWVAFAKCWSLAKICRESDALVSCSLVALLGLFMLLTACSEKYTSSPSCVGQGNSNRSAIPIHMPDGNVRSMGITEVTNVQFSEFVQATDYVTLAEQIDPVTDRPRGSAVFQQPKQAMGRWWRLDESANWRQPTGLGSSIDDLGDYPVVHVAYEDALAYALWLGADIPTQSEWSAAAVGGPDHYADGGGRNISPSVGNTWQGYFPFENVEADGFAGAAPVGCYPPDEQGLFDMSGNVWEWTKPDLADAHFSVLVGGSYLCSENFCRNGSPRGRQLQELSFSASHIGFRVILDAAPTVDR